MYLNLYYFALKYSSIAFAAVFPAPIAEITVAAPVTASPPAYTPSIDVRPSSFCESASLNMPANLENAAVATGLEKGQFSFQSQRKAMGKNVQTTTQLHSSHTLVK